MVVARNNGAVGLTGFSDKKMSRLLFGPQKSGRNNGVVVWRGSTVITASNLTQLTLTINKSSKNVLLKYSFNLFYIVL